LGGGSAIGVIDEIVAQVEAKAAELDAKHAIKQGTELALAWGTN